MWQLAQRWISSLPALSPSQKNAVSWLSEGCGGDGPSGFSVAAAFGLKRLLLSGGTEKIAFHPEAWNQSRGAMEQLRLMRAAALGGLLKLVEDRCCVVALSPDIGRKIDLGTPVRVPARHLALLIPGGKLDPDIQPRVEHCYRFPGQMGETPLTLSEMAPMAVAWFASTPMPRADGFLARKRARHVKGKDSNSPS